MYILIHRVICIDNDGPYYWHIKSGIIQREPPTSAICEETNEQLKDIDAVRFKSLQKKSQQIISNILIIIVFLSRYYLVYRI